MSSITRPFKKRDEEDEMLVPDWRRGSWRIGIDGTDDRGGYSEKDPAHFAAEDYGQYGISEHEKSGLTMQPVSPFPRRSPSCRTAASKSPGLEGGDANALSIKVQPAGSYALLPSPPPAAHTFTSVRGDGECNPFSDPHVAPHLDVYGGME